MDKVDSKDLDEFVPSYITFAEHLELARKHRVLLRKFKALKAELEDKTQHVVDQRVKIDQLLAYNANLKATLDKLVD